MNKISEILTKEQIKALKLEAIKKQGKIVKK